MPIDLTIYPVKNQVQIIKANSELMTVFNTITRFEDFVSELEMEVICSPETVQYFKDKFN